MTKIAFRVDGGNKIGMGHLMRSLALANAFPEDIDIYFMIKREESVLKLLSQYRFKILEIGETLKKEEEINKVKELIRSNNIDILITDSYEIDQDYLIETKEIVKKLVTIHDFAPFAFPSDIVINGNIYAPWLDYRSLNGHTQFLLGTDYTLMREEFKNLPERKINKKVENILVTMGGSDKLNLTPKIIRVLNQLEEDWEQSECFNKDELHIDVVIGSAFANLEEIIAEVRKSSLEIDLHFNVKKMSSLMLNNDLAISAGGSTLYELAATGTPAVVLLQADNQVLVAEAMEKAGVIRNLGFGNCFKDDELKLYLKSLISDLKARINMSKRAQKLLDGKGSEKCKDVILSQMPKQFVLNKSNKMN